MDALKLGVANPTDVPVIVDMQTRLWEYEGRPSNDPMGVPEIAYDLIANITGTEDRGCVIVARAPDRSVKACIIAAIEMTATGAEGEAGGLFVEDGCPLHTAEDLVRAAAIWYKRAGIQVVRVTLSQETPRGDRTRAFHHRIGFVPESIIMRANTDDVLRNMGVI